jgi:hypothetical protein
LRVFRIPSTAVPAAEWLSNVHSPWLRATLRRPPMEATPENAGQRRVIAAGCAPGAHGSSNAIRRLVRERVLSAAPWASIAAEAQNAGTNPSLPGQDRSRATASASNANVEPSARIDWLDYVAEVERPTVDAGPRLQAAVEPPGKPGIQKQRPFITRSQKQQSERQRARGITAIQKRERRAEYSRRNVVETGSRRDFGRSGAG